MSSSASINGEIFGSNPSVASTQGYWDAIKDNYSITTQGLGGAGWFSFSLDETHYVAPEVLPPPRNVMVSTPFLTNRAYDIRWDRSPSLFVLGYGVYRSYRQIGTYERITDSVIQTAQFRDMNTDKFIEQELVPQSDNLRPSWRIEPNGKYVIRTAKCPIVKAGGFGDPTTNPEDVVVEIDGQVVFAEAVAGDKGEITLSSTVYYDRLRNEFVNALLPDLNSEVRVSYWYQGNFLDREKLRHLPPYYKITSVAYDLENNCLVETNPDLVKPTTLHIEQLDWIWKEAIRRNGWIAEIAGERTNVWQKKKAGVVCGCVFRDHNRYYPSRECTECYGTGFIGGFDGPYPLIVVIPFSERSFELGDRGMHRTDTFEGMWAPPDPMMEQFDLMLRQDGTLYEIGPVKRPNHRGFMALQQRFSTEFLSFGKIQHKLLETLETDTRTLQPEDGRIHKLGANFNTIHLLAEKSPEPTVHYKGNTFRYPTISY